MFFPHGHAHVWVRTRHLHALAGPLRQHLRKAAEDGRNHGGKHGGNHGGCGFSWFSCQILVVFFNLPAQHEIRRNIELMSIILARK